MIGYRIQFILCAVLLYFISADIQQRPYHTETTFLSFIGDACKSVGTCTSQDSEKNSLRLIVGILRHSDFHLRFRHFLRYFPCYLVKRIIPGFAPGFLTCHSKLFCQLNTVHHECATRYSALFTELLCKVLVPFRGTWSEFVIHMNRMQRQIIFFPETQQYMKKAHRIGTS